MAYLKHATLAFTAVLFGWPSKAQALISFFCSPSPKYNFPGGL